MGIGLGRRARRPCGRKVRKGNASAIDPLSFSGARPTLLTAAKSLVGTIASRPPLEVFGLAAQALDWGSGHGVGPADSRGRVEKAEVGWARGGGCLPNQSMRRSSVWTEILMFA
jgi:hypothetical protein